ncbi:MAG: hypothetical protein Kow00107_04550 [Planctomycetota bacterium]
MDTMRWTLTALLITAVLLSGCVNPFEAPIPEEVTSARLEYVSAKGRLLHVKTVLNAEAPSLPPYEGVTFTSESAALTLSEADSPFGPELLDYFDRSYAFFSALRIGPLPRLNITILHASELPSKWEGALGNNRLDTVLYYTGDKPIVPAGKWKRLDGDLGIQLVATWHELVEVSLIYGSGMRIPLGDEQRLRWIREGLATYLGARTIDSLYLCRMFKGSQLEFKYYYAGEMGADILKWRESRGGLWNRGYAASLGLMYAFNAATNGAFPRDFCQRCAAEKRETADEIYELLEELLGMPLEVFIDSVRRPLPDLMPERNSVRLTVPSKNFVYSDAPGLKPRDEFLSIAGMPVNNLQELDSALWEAGRSERFMITVRRNGESVQVPCTPKGPRMAARSFR